MGEAIITRRGGVINDAFVGFTNYPEFTYDGNYEMFKYADGNWTISFLSSGTLNITKLGNMSDGVDIFLVGGGGNGTANTQWHDSTSGSGAHYVGGDGGGSAYTATIKGEFLQAISYPIVVAEAEGTTSGFGYSAEGGSGADGKRKGGEGVSAGVGTYVTSGKGQDGEYAFDDPDFVHYMGAGYKFAASGSGGSGHGGGSSDWAKIGAAGKDGAGKGSKYNVAGTDATPNSGSGAGGCGGKLTAGSNTKGIGGSGIIIMRNAR